MDAMDPNSKGGAPNGRGANYNYNPTQRLDHPSSSSPPPKFQPQGAYPESFGVGIPTDDSISACDFAPLAVTMPGPGRYHYSERVAPRPSMPNVIGSQYQYQPHPDSATVFPALGNSNSVIPHATVYPTRPGVYAQHPGSATVFSTPGYNYDSSVSPHAPVYPPGPGPAVYPQQPGSATVFSAPGYNYNNSVIPHAPVYPPRAGVYAQQPGSAAVINAHGYNSNPLHASVYQPGAPVYPQPGAATDLSARDGNANNDPYTSAGLIAPPPNANQGAASRGPVAGVPNHLRASPAAFATNPETSEKLISMLKQDNHECRVMVTRWVLEDVRMVMGSHTGHAVLLALLAALERANMLVTLEAIVSGAISHQYNGPSLMEVANVSCGELALKVLVRLAALHFHPVVLRRLFRCLIDGWKMEQTNGEELLRYFFTTLHFDHCSIFIDELVVARFWDMIRTRIGYMSMVVCLENARYTEQGTTLQNIIVTRTVQIANERYGSCFLRTVLGRGRNGQLEERIRERVVQNLVELSMGRYGNEVVQECFVPRDKEPSVPLLKLGLDAFFRLPDEQLRELVQNHWAGCVLRRLLQTSVQLKLAEEEATELAERILGFVAAGDETDAVLPRPTGDPREQATAILQ